MNHEYKTKYDQIKENQPGQADLGSDQKSYPNPGHNRNVGFIWPNGDSEAFNYAYLIRIRLDTNDNAIYLVFTTHTIKIEGFGLQKLFFELFDQRNRIVECIDERYKKIADSATVVTKITVAKNS